MYRDRHAKPFRERMPPTLRSEDLKKFREFIEAKLEESAQSNVGEDSKPEDADLLNAKDLVI